ncbi:unnamed protein product [Protopolystoma xenopodis]|uniref:Uncharacterized protein n=1 Tax=Protopolystoma xenopodis TaxID=117903 RepID=A0A448XFD0_9PLAT|nr:unnamed protein product [Protopolystoma xenopodis]
MYSRAGTTGGEGDNRRRHSSHDDAYIVSSTCAGRGPCGLPIVLVQAAVQPLTFHIWTLSILLLTRKIFRIPHRFTVCYLVCVLFSCIGVSLGQLMLEAGTGDDNYGRTADMTNFSLATDPSSRLMHISPADGGPTMDSLLGLSELQLQTRLLYPHFHSSLRLLSETLI